VVYILREDLTTVEKTGVCCRVAARIGLAESSGISGVRCERYTERRRLTVVAHLSAPQLNKRATRPTIERKGRGTGPTEADLARVKVSFALFLFLFFLFSVFHLILRVSNSNVNSNMYIQKFSMNCNYIFILNTLLI
jgi:hypothetical protein